LRKSGELYKIEAFTATTGDKFSGSQPREFAVEDLWRILEVTFISQNYNLYSRHFHLAKNSYAYSDY
jgi:hypothetical protein